MTKRGYSETTRRDVIKGMAGLAAATALPALAETTKPAGTIANSVNPRWYGFNLLEYFSTDTDWMQHFPYKNDGMFKEDDFRWIRDWGFNWVRLPMDYRFWTDPKDLMKINEKAAEPIDRAIRLGEKYGVHVNVCLCRAPGEWIMDGADANVFRIRQDSEKTSVYTDPATFDAFVHQWAFLAARYKGIAGKDLSFNLVNEPLERGKPLEVGMKDYARLARASIEAIRGVDPQRLIVSDGYQVAREPVPELYDTGVVQSCHQYSPGQLTHFRCPWSRPASDQWTTPTWPLKDGDGKVISNKRIEGAFLNRWADPGKHGVPIHFGEMGCYHRTSPELVYAWFGDMLDLIGELRSGWALWNFRGDYGILDSNRAGTKYTDWHGHQLDTTLLKLLQSRIKA